MIDLSTPEPVPAQAALMHRISRIVSSELSLDQMLAEILVVAVQVSAGDACLVYLLEKTTSEIILWASQVPHARPLGKLRMKLGDGVTIGPAAHDSVIALTAHAGQDPRFKQFPSLIEDTHEAFLSIPLASSGEVVGVINIHFRHPREFPADLIAFLTFIGEQMGGAVARNVLAEENRRLHEEALEMKRQLAARKLVERAKGILMRRFSLSEEEAYLRLRNDSRRSRRAMRDLAEHIIQTEIHALDSQ
ncbi:MAG: GAF and ANTAR domain-containing protein [Bryobacterales bacterium]|nr:GAF and ANTAR domain-containing protein [Bryobacterales bacterium]